MVERQSVLLRQRFEIAMIRADADDVHFQLTHAPAEQQVGETVLELRHHDQNLRPCADIVHCPRHAETLGDRFEFALERRNVQRLAAVDAMKHTAHEEALAEVVVENGQFVDIAMMPVEKADDGGNLARRARTGDGEN
jgi:hypothetical protein